MSRCFVSGTSCAAGRCHRQSGEEEFGATKEVNGRWVRNSRRCRRRLRSGKSRRATTTHRSGLRQRCRKRQSRSRCGGRLEWYSCVRSAKATRVDVWSHVQASEEEQNHHPRLLLSGELSCCYGRQWCEEDDTVEEDVQRSNDDARLLTLQLTLSWRMAHADPARERPDIPNRDE
jgi:hypothetical protein